MATRRGILALAVGAVWLPGGAGAMVATQRHLFGSPMDLMLPPAAAPSVRDGVLRGLEAMNREWNAWKPGQLGTINRAFAQGRSAPVAPQLREMMQRAALLEQASSGLFNPAIGGLVGAWGFHDDDLRPGRRPTQSTLAGWLAARPSLAQLEFRGGEVFSRNPRLQLDFGAYAKGVAIDWALDRLHRAGVDDALLNLGGNLAATGGNAGAPWRIGIRDPQGPGLAAWLDTRGREAVVTSGSYERFRVLDGEPVTHILDPFGGAPAPGLVSVTVVHPSAALADAAATALLVAGPGRWSTVAERMGVDQVLVIDRHGRRTASPRLAPRLHLT